MMERNPLVQELVAFEQQRLELQQKAVLALWFAAVAGLAAEMGAEVGAEAAA